MKRVRLALLKENGQPLGWLISAVTLSFLGGCFLWALAVPEVMTRLVQGESVLYLIGFLGSAGMTLKKPLSWFSRKEGA
jgi:hypothetical protein